MTSYLLGGISIVALAAVAFAGVQSSRLASTQSELATTRTELDVSEARRRGAEFAHREIVEQLAAVSKQADASARREAALRERIARDTNTDRDGPTAPVLRDTIRDLEKIGTRQDDWYVGRRRVWRLVVMIDGVPTNIIETKDQAACIGAAGAAADAVRELPNYASELKGKVRISCGLTTPAVAA
ncbi:hypothetical protein H9Q09_11855 [Aurantimonas sp. DM33-3]|uniref:hypothetical protein n=1 Tax=Aurantimonas sp. DM33-3 TaxID=2766955 RepID=UPI0016524740|nr:hypothetical protein [Aurantimonas sp. DM33-3]MBC6716902.1 hypothetical protein [Aurantimonas sp. DM33-3]